METVGHWLPVGSEGKQGGSSNDQRSPGECEAVSRRAAALLLNFISIPAGIRYGCRTDAEMTRGIRTHVDGPLHLIRMQRSKALRLSSSWFQI